MIYHLSTAIFQKKSEQRESGREDKIKLNIKWEAGGGDKERKEHMMGKTRNEWLTFISCSGVLEHECVHVVRGM